MLEQASKNAVQIFHKYLPQILTGFGITASLGSVILAWNNGQKAHERIENRKSIENVDKLSVKQTISEIWPEVLSVGTTFALGTAGIVAGQIISGKRLTAVSTALALTEKSFEEYRKTVRETVGKAKSEKVEADAARKSIDQNPLSEASIVEHSDNGGTTLCYDTLTGRYFYCDIDTIRRAELYILKRISTEMYVCWNDWFNALGLRGIELGTELGFNADYAPFELILSSLLIDDSIPCISLSYGILPRYDYANLH